MASLTTKPVYPSAIPQDQARPSAVLRPVASSPRLPLFLQPKLAISQPSDPYEQEADRVADQVMRMAGPTVQRQCAACAAGGPPCQACEDERVQVSRKAHGNAGGEAPASVHSVLSSPGQPLPASTRAFFEPRFGQDLGEVRVHTDGAAQQSARDVSALAYTVGSHVVFDAGRYAPHSTEGQKLLAHELTHVVQQQAGHLHRKLKVDSKASDDPATAVTTIQPLVKALCPDFDVAIDGTVGPKAGTASAKFNFGSVVKGAQPVGCCCLSTMTAAPKDWKIIVTTKDSPTTSSSTREVRMTPTAGSTAPELRYWTGGASQTVQALPFVEAFGHELCGHAVLMQIQAHPSETAPDSDRAYSDVHDPTVRVENALATEMGLGGSRRGLAGSGSHRGESLRVFTVGPYGADADDPAPHATQIKAAVDFLNGNERLMVDEVGFRDKADTLASVSQTRASKVASELTKGITKDTVAVETTPGVDETLKRIQPATDGGGGAAPVVELRMAVRPAGLIAPVGAAPPATPAHVDPGFPGVVKALKAGKKVNACHALLASTAWT